MHRPFQKVRADPLVAVVGVDEQQVDRPVRPLAGRLHRLAPDRADDRVDAGLAGDVPFKQREVVRVFAPQERGVERTRFPDVGEQVGGVDRGPRIRRGCRRPA